MDLPPVLPVHLEPAARAEVTTAFDDEATQSIPFLPAAGKVPAAGKRKAVRPAAPRATRFRRLPSAPVLVGIAALAVSAGGALVVDGSTDGSDGQPTPFTQAASSLVGTSKVSSVDLAATDRRQVISRDSARDALESAADKELQAAVEKQYQAHTGALQSLAERAGKYARVVEQNTWVAPLAGYRLTATFGEYGLWSSYHTGLDFAAPSGTPIVSIANGTVTEAGYDGAYGNKTVVTLEDGTEIWYCHQTAIEVSVGQQLRAGDRIGSVGSTGNVTGPHLHLEVRPGAGDPVDPYDALAVNGITP
ncbi:M23 family metallopeptidase [Nocardioides dongkuii]|uniref:M23 family metallopeptidase n=1 Tax=Nocardioides dongkuii TaxID=2760089 RepID=UPI001C6FDE8C|nr:M23 family metallopeptidase [Nocardioides dongkuii]